MKACESTGNIGVLRSGRLDFHEPNGTFIHSFPQKYGHVQAYSWAADGRIHIATSTDMASQLHLWDPAAITRSLLNPPDPMDFRIEALASHSGGLAIATSLSEVLSLELSGNHVSGGFKVLDRGAALRITDLHADPAHPYVAWVKQDNYSSKKIVVVNPATDERGVINPAGQILQGPIIAPAGNELYFLARPTSPISGTAAPSLSEPVLCAVQLSTSSGQCLLSPDVRVLARRLTGVLSLTRTRGGIAAVTRSAVHMVWPHREQPFHKGEKFLGDASTIAFAHENETAVLGRSPVRLKADVPAWGTQRDKQGLLDEVIHIARCYALHGADKEWPGPAAMKRYQSSVARSKTLPDLAKVLRQLLGELGLSHTAILDQSPAASNFIDDRTIDCVSFFDGSRRWVTQGALTDATVHPPVQISAVNGAVVPAGVDPYSVVLPGPGPGTVTLVIPGEGSKEVSFSHASESNQWYNDEIEECSELVSAATQGTAQYLHLPDVAAAGVQAVEQLCRGWSERSTLILDLRFNTGGPFADYLSAILQNLFRRRAIMERGKEQNALLGGPSRGIVLLNERTGSGGENLAALLSQSPFVTLVGSRSFGAGTGFMRTHKLGGGLLMTVPEFELSSSHGQARIENHGVEPDIEIPKASKSQRPLANTDLLLAVQHVVEGEITVTQYREVR
ncbi:S41 family peptidase [Arthrobacter sp. ISL-69]|uniref:S41 family peptidase n=1 Tax=Arthrobacter sp. ISL-69 TaxID=2819113 RepID=UPI0028891DA9|nr:S41 family peptidase [Arthrobacter sp. ISL-69]